MFNKNIDDEPACVCVCLCNTNILTKNKILSLSNYNVRIHNILQKFAAHQKPCGGTPVTALQDVICLKNSNLIINRYETVRLKINY
jgi:hypothetical protein